MVCFPVAGVECPIAVAACEDFRPLDLDERRKQIAHAAWSEQGPRKRPRQKGDAVDFAIVVNGPCSVELPTELPNLDVIRRNNSCFDFGAWGQVLTRLRKSYYTLSS